MRYGYREPCMCGAYDCVPCRGQSSVDEYNRSEEAEPLEAEHVRYVVARKARRDFVGNPINVGDVVAVVAGFEYTEGGPRSSYYHYERSVHQSPSAMEWVFASRAIRRRKDRLRRIRRGKLVLN